MGILGFLLLFIVCGVLTWLAITYLPMPAQFKTALPIIVLVLLILVLVFEVLGVSVGDVRIPKVR